DAPVELGREARGFEPGQRGERPVRLGLRPTRERRARAVPIAYRREQLAAQDARERDRHRLDDRRERALGPVADDGVDPREAARRLRVPRRLLEDPQVADARAVEIARAGGVVGLARELA